MNKSEYDGVKLLDLPRLAQQIKEQYAHQKIWAFYGQMGAGKTTFIQQLCRALDVEGGVLSPTFAIVNEYSTKSGFPVFHFDFYRIKEIEEAYDIGYEEYFFSGNLCLIEWPERIEELLQLPHIKINIEVKEDQTRHFTIEEIA